METYERRDKLKLEILESSKEEEHFHQDIELVYVLRGTLDVTVKTQVSHMKKDDVLIINTNQPHKLLGSDQVMYLRLTISYEIMGDVLKDQNVMLACDSTKSHEESTYEGLRQLLQKLLSHYIFVHGNIADFLHISLCYQIMDYITHNFLIQKTAPVGEAEAGKYEERIREIDNYMQSSYRSPISMKDLSERLHLSNGYLSRFFKNAYGMSFAEYVTHIRLDHALNELLYTDQPIIRIVYDNGFANVAVFNRAFKKEYGKTPSQMRREVQGTATKPADTKEILSKATEEQVANVLWADTDERQLPDQNAPEEVLDASGAVKYKPYWSDAINIGSAADLMRSDVRDHVILLKQALNFRYVRFWSPFSVKLLINANDPDHHYNFTQLDSILDFLLETGVRPFIDLASKPERLQETTESSLLYDLHEKVNSAADWQALIRAFMNHIVLRYGREEVSTWRFEFWYDILALPNKPEVALYFQQLRITLEEVRKTADTPVGCAGLHTLTESTGEKTRQVADFYRRMADADIMPDFLTAYSYNYDTAYTAEGITNKQNSDPDFVLRGIRLLRGVLPEKFTQLPIYITEWNLTISDRNLINDTCFKGAYIIKNYIDLFGKVDAMIYFRGTDILSEYYDTSHFLFGGTGLLSRDGIMKPSAYAFDFLNRLYPCYIGKGTNYIATSNGEDHYAIVCHNMKKLNYNYYRVDEDKLDITHMNKYYEDLNPLTLKFLLIGVPDGTYHVKFYRINSHSGSIQQIWEKMNCEEDLSRDDIRYFRRACEPVLSMDNLTVKGGNASFSVTLDANEIAFIRLRRRTVSE